MRADSCGKSASEYAMCLRQRPAGVSLLRNRSESCAPSIAKETIGAARQKSGEGLANGELTAAEGRMPRGVGHCASPARRTVDSLPSPAASRRGAGGPHLAAAARRARAEQCRGHAGIGRCCCSRRATCPAAEHQARNAIRLAPTNPRSHNLMAMILTEAQRPHIGEFHYRRVLEISGDRDPILLANLAWNLKCQGKIAEARELYSKSTQAAPDVFPDAFRLGTARGSGWQLCRREGQARSRRRRSARRSRSEGRARHASGARGQACRGACGARGRTRPPAKAARSGRSPRLQHAFGEGADTRQARAL